MVYRIRYREAGTTCPGEADVEANSPTEALVKFCHTQAGAADVERTADSIISVCAQPAIDAGLW